MKIIAVDNYNRDLYDDQLVADHIVHNVHADTMCAALNAKYDHAGAQYYYVVVKDDYVLRTYH